MRLFFFSSTHVILAFIPTLGPKHSHKVLFPAIAGDNPHMDFHGYAGLRVPFRHPVYVSTHLRIHTHILPLTDCMHGHLNVAKFYQC